MSTRRFTRPCLAGALVALLAALVLAVVRPALAEEASQSDSDTDLAKKTQNPVADLVSVPFQNNFNFLTGPEQRSVWVMNVQPVIPFHLTEDWNLITRWIVPVINQPELAPGVEHAFGMGDVNPSFFLSPANSGSVIWGVGPTFTFPTATNSELGQGKWSMGPTAVALTMQGPWVAGALVNNQWSVAGWGDTDVNQFLMQPFVNYNFAHGWYLTTAPILTANWKESGGNRWTVPVGGGGGKLFRLGDVLGEGIGKLAKLPINTQVQAFVNAARPEYAAQWQLRFQLQFLFPR